MKKLFLSHQHRRADAVADLATELRYRGIVPWIDKQGGFSVGDLSREEATRAIKEDCFGMLLYASCEVFDSGFIAEVEVPAALEAAQTDPRFLLMAAPVEMGFAELSEKCERCFGTDLSARHGIAVRKNSAHWDHVAIAKDVLHWKLSRTPLNGAFRLQFSTREVMPCRTDHDLLVDGRGAYESGTSWDSLVGGLRDVKAQLSQAHGRPLLEVDGSKHLSAAFLFGRVFQPFELRIRQTPSDYWESVGVLAPVDLEVQRREGDPTELVIMIASRFKTSSEDNLAQIGLEGKSRTSIRPSVPPLSLDGPSARSFARQVYDEVERDVARLKPTRIQLLIAAPQSVAMMLGQLFAGMPETLLYDWGGERYASGRTVPGGVL